MNDLISRQAAIDALVQELKFKPDWFWDNGLNRYDIESVLKALPAAEPDMSAYSDKLWRNAYERGKAEAEPKTGKWIEAESDHVERCWECSECGFLAWGSYEKTSFCGGCGAKMVEERA